MARITVEDCLAKENNRFSLVQLAAKRTKQILSGSKPLISDSRANKAVVTSLREIADGKVRFMTPEEALAAKEAAAIQQREEAARQAEAAAAAAAAQVASTSSLDSLFSANPVAEEDSDTDDVAEVVEEGAIEDLDDDNDDEDSEDEDSDDDESDDEPSTEKDPE